MSWQTFINENKLIYKLSYFYQVMQKDVLFSDNKEKKLSDHELE
jgi:hypothetical protein